MEPLTEKKCVPCEGKISPLSESQEKKYLQQVSGWELNHEGIHRISKKFIFKDFKESMQFVTAVADLAEEEGHHPDIHIYYNHVNLELHTHAIKGLHQNDFILASKINKINKY
ncbi:MAG: 4a-hydroxytetrahydrobiopterin dehydratase [Candidatus Lokiarchaeota archaeon]|nr:4a-hydroxytetrahydrobiopterin dehydratase [Candidatus Lokiarchaeota archaeon]